jgi:hypothetical protein
MSREKDMECRAMLLDETPNAIHVCTLHSSIGCESWWIPRSQIGYMRKDKVDAPFADGGANTHVVFTCPEWFIEKKQCWELVP